MTLKFYTSVTKELKLKVRKIFEVNFEVLEVTGEGCRSYGKKRVVGLFRLSIQHSTLTVHPE